MIRNLYPFIRKYSNERILMKPKDFKIWVEQEFRVRYLDRCISCRAKELSLDDSTTFAQHYSELASDVAFQREAWELFLQAVDKLDRDSQEFLPIRRYYKQDTLVRHLVNRFVSFITAPFLSVNQLFRIKSRNMKVPRHSGTNKNISKQANDNKSYSELNPKSH
ncbi:MAG: hypothetical protein FJ005_00690 [Chloroflexi bacterium]|nr:hypothetical protein [Chloroflexota bacterium]